MNLRKKLARLFITFMVFFGALMNAAVAISSNELYLMPQSICEDIFTNKFFYQPQTLLSVHNVIFPKSLTIDQVQDIEKHFPDAINVNELSKQTGNFTYKITTSSGESFFYKVTENDEKRYNSVEHEAGVSIIANYISDGFIPQGRTIKNSLIYPYIDIDIKKTEEVFANESQNIYEKLTPEQRIELFINMLCDMVLFNPDTHPGHFGITQDGHLVSFNKEYAYSSIFTNNTINFNMADNFFSESKIYQNFAQELKNHPEELKNLLNDSRVNEAFLRINTLTALRIERECVKKILAQLFAFIEQGGDKEQFSNNYFKTLGNISDFLAGKLNSKEYFKEDITIKETDDGVKIVTFNTKLNKMVLITAKEQGFLHGARAQEIAKGATNVVAAMNSGFFDYGYDTSNYLNLAYGKLVDLSYKKLGLDIIRNSAYPIAIQKAYVPTLGINASGNIKIGEVKVVWSARLSKNGKKIALSHVQNSKIDPDIMNAILYYKNDSCIRKIAVSNNKVLNIETVSEVATGKPNCYWLHEPSQETINDFDSLREGDYLNYSYEFAAAAYPEQKETDDPELTSFFNNCPYVVSGGQLLINNSEVDPRISKEYARPAYTAFGTAVCIHKDGITSLMVKEDDLPSNAFIQHLKEEQCEYAISLDGGGSTTLVIKEDEDKNRYYGHNRVVTDVIGIMRRCSNSMLSDILSKEGV